MIKKNAFLYVCHNIHKDLIMEYQKILRATKNIGDCFLLFHLNKEEKLPELSKYHPYYFTDQSLSQLNFPRFREDMLGSTHLSVIQFYHDYPDYDYYWRIEYDVRFSGDWRIFFESFTRWNEDFLSCHIRNYYNGPNWPWWYLYPNEKIPLTQRYASFNPIFRISKPALKIIDQLQHDGWCGHQEVLFATLLFHNNFQLRDFGGTGKFVHPGDENRFYINGKYPENCTMRFLPNFTVIPKNGNKLYHPLKPTEC